MQILPGVDFVFGSIVTIIIIMSFGPFWGTAAATLSGIYTIVLWQHPYALLIFVIEAIIIGTAYVKTKKNIVLLDAMFWVFIGLPLIIVFYYGIMDISWPAVKLIFLKQCLNGILNSLSGCIIVYILNSSSLLDLKYKINYSTLIYNVIMIFVLIPILGFVMYEGQDKYNSFQEQAVNRIVSIADEVTQNLEVWFDYQMTPIIELAKEFAQEDLIDDTQAKLELVRRLSPDYKTLYVADEEGKTLAFAPPVNEKGDSTLGLDFSDREYYQLVKEQKTPIVSDVFMGRGGVFEPIVCFNAPILQDNKFSGFVCGSSNLNSVTQILQAISSELYISLLDSKQQVIATTHPDLAALAKHNIFADYQKYRIAEDIYYLSLEKDPQSKLSMSENSYYVYIDDNFFDDKNIDRTLIIQMPMRPTFISLYHQLSNVLLLAIFVLFLVIIIGHLVSRGIVQSLRDITLEADDLPDKITKKLYGRWPESQINEVNSLVTTFRLVEQRLQDSFEKIRKNETKFRYLAHHDSLTGLPNKLYFEKMVNEKLQSLKKMKVVMFLDLDGFNVVNDTLGHSEGDLLLVQVAERLKTIMRGEEFLARQGGDEFFLYAEIADVEEAKTRAENLLKEISRPYDLRGLRLNVTATIGVCIYPLHGETAEVLLKKADIALYAGKKTGRNSYYLFQDKFLSDINKKLDMERKLWNAFINREFIIHYQPILDIKDSRIIGAEALLRWQPPENSLPISPNEFIPLAEETGFIIPLGEWVINRAVQQAAKWQENLGLKVFIAVNVSARQFLDENFISIVSEALAESGLKPQHLILEITETKVMEHLDVALKKITELKSLGVKLALDDFGTGYSSLSYLKQFPIDTLKIDRSFIFDLKTNRHNASLVSAVIEIAHTFNLRVVAEGVEHEDQLQELSYLNCDYFQGFLFAKPLSSTEFEQMLRGEL